jgi:hypothetical protein
MSELAQSLQQQRLENKKLEKLFFNSRKKLLQLSLAISQKKERVSHYFLPTYQINIQTRDVDIESAHMNMLCYIPH